MEWTLKTASTHTIVRYLNAIIVRFLNAFERICTHFAAFVATYCYRYLDVAYCYRVCVYVSWYVRSGRSVSVSLFALRSCFVFSHLLLSHCFVAFAVPFCLSHCWRLFAFVLHSLVAASFVFALLHCSRFVTPFALVALLQLLHWLHFSFRSPWFVFALSLCFVCRSARICRCNRICRGLGFCFCSHCSSVLSFGYRSLWLVSFVRFCCLGLFFRSARFSALLLCSL